MPNKPSKSVSAIFAGVLAGVSLAGVSHNAARAADDCLAAPKDETPEGSHWYYRIDRATKRHCWYLRAEGEKLSQTAPANASGSAKPAASIAAPPMQRSVADAHAELTPQTSIEPPKRNDGPIPAKPADPAVSEDSAQGPDPQQSVVATRWPDPSAASPAVSPQPATNEMAANEQNDQSDSAAAPPPAIAAVPLTAADSSQGLPASIPMLLAVMTGALALAGITASLVLKFGGARRSARLRVRRDKIWESADDYGIRLAVHPDADVVPRRPYFPRDTSFPRDLDQTGEPDDRVAEFFAQLSKQARS